MAFGIFYGYLAYAIFSGIGTVYAAFSWGLSDAIKGAILFAVVALSGYCIGRLMEDTRDWS